MLDEVHIGFTGTRTISGFGEHRWRDFLRTVREFSVGKTLYFHHGDCLGADAMAHDLVAGRQDQGLSGIKIGVVVHPPSIPTQRAWRAGPQVVDMYPPKAYLDRNHDIVDVSDMMIAMPKDPMVEVLRSGTWATIRYARKVGKPVYIL